MTEKCFCLACIRRVADGQPPFEGVSLSRSQHITEDDLASPKQSREIVGKWEELPAVPTISWAQVKGALNSNNQTMLEAMGDALAIILTEEIKPLVQRIKLLEIQVAHLSQPRTTRGGRSDGPTA